MLQLRFAKKVILSCLMASLFAGSIQAEEDSVKVTKEMVAGAEDIIGLKFTDAERDSMLDELSANLEFYDAMRAVSLQNSVSPSLIFNPIPVGMTFETTQRPLEMSPIAGITIPDDLEKLAFYSVRELAELVRTRQVTSMQLTRLALDRLKKFDPQLHCVITLTEELALNQAARADSEIAAGKYRGPLHGIPYGAKDLLAVAKKYQDSTDFHKKHPTLFE